MRQAPTFHRHVAGPRFFENKTPYHHYRLRIGEAPDRPFKMFVPLDALPFGDFVNAVSLAAQHAASFKHSMTTFAFVNDRPSKRAVLALYPRLWMAHPCKERDELARFNVLYFRPASRHEVDGKLTYRPAIDVIADPRWQDIFFPALHAHQAYNFDRPFVPFRISPKSAEPLHKQLVGLGLDAARWFCCLHYREPNYAWKRVSNLRDSDPNTYLPLIDHVIDRLGGQVVRLGHPEMRDRAPRAGFVDLAKVENSTPLQAYAASRARFSVMSPSGGACLVRAFNTPLGVTDACNWFEGVNEHEFLFTHTVVTPEGGELRQDELFESGLMNQTSLELEIERGGVSNRAKLRRADLPRCRFHVRIHRGRRRLAVAVGSSEHRPGSDIHLAVTRIAWAEIHRSVRMRDRGFTESCDRGQPHTLTPPPSALPPPAPSTRTTPKNSPAAYARARWRCFPGGIARPGSAGCGGRGP